VLVVAAAIGAVVGGRARREPLDEEHPRVMAEVR
jgi:hypothetical protein